ncbi:MAG: ribosome maturation factor RimM [Dokdonella sp.]|uniref:ribosome maturation factor RimM n=1 Tax=Dokdonella sp. TaxID=2291710 RepID=UPI002CE8236D|nr:ribosome maturation factor RimM [Dokdonella sp.]HOX71592.1 ribosome maturation factor RimM [Dokdonella sp.]HPG94088.1 ribosome maturation factor RimM [Dokdonella sp.]HPN79561.1 ribosome maturation factor RimM [Dokdonella sp.]
MAAGDRLILVGRIVGLHGVAGEVKLESYTEPRSQIFRYQPWLLSSATGDREISGCRGREQGKGMVATLPDVVDRDRAASLVGCEIKVRRSALPEPRPDEYYWTDLEGLEVITIDGVALGRISHLLATGANDVMVVRDGERERLLPFVLEDYVKTVDFEAGRVTVDWDPEF